MTNLEKLKLQIFGDLKGDFEKDSEIKIFENLGNLIKLQEFEMQIDSFLGNYGGLYLLSNIKKLGKLKNLKL